MQFVHRVFTHELPHSQTNRLPSRDKSTSLYTLNIISQPRERTGRLHKPQDWFLSAKIVNPKGMK